MIQCSARQNKYFQRCNDRNDRDCKNFGTFIAWIEITINFESQRLGLIHDQHLESSNFNHLRTTFPLIASYFLTHLCIIKLLVHTLRKYTTRILRRKWKSIPILIGNTVPYWLPMGQWLVMGGSTLIQSTC